MRLFNSVRADENAWTAAYLLIGIVLTFCIGFVGALVYIEDAKADPFADHSVHWNQTGTTSKVLIDLPYPRNCVWVTDCGFNPTAPAPVAPVVPEPYADWDRHVPIEKTGWAVTVDNVEDSNAQKLEMYAAEHAIDGDPLTIWHSRWVAPAVPMPHWVKVDLGEEHWVDSMTVTPRPWRADCSYCITSNVREFEVWVSKDDNIWSRVADGELAFVEGAPQQIQFLIPNKARYVRLDITSASGDTPAVTLGEIDLTEMLPPLEITGGGVN